MAEDLWKLRKRRGMTVSQLANKAGVPALSIQEYEQGQPVRMADLSRLAKALFVDEFDIKIQSDPKPAGKPRRPPEPLPSAPAPAPVPSVPPEPKQKAASPPVKPARPTQVTHLLDLARKLGQDEQMVEEVAGKPLDELSLAEARQLLHDYTAEIKAQKEEAEANRPDGTRRKRAQLPEGIDDFELNYLAECRESGDEVSFHLLSGKVFTGRVIGFSPYHIIIDEGNGTETTLHKLALAYYTRTTAPKEAEEEAHEPG